VTGAGFFGEQVEAFLTLDTLAATPLP
jgi:hypothetical protein